MPVQPRPPSPPPGARAARPRLDLAVRRPRTGPPDLAGPVIRPGLPGQLRGGRRPADQLDEPEDQQQDDDQHDDKHRGGLADEDEYQGEQRYRADPQHPAVQVSPVADRAGRHPPAFAEVPDPLQPRLNPRAGPDRGVRWPAEVSRDGHHQSQHQQGGGGINCQLFAGVKPDPEPKSGDIVTVKGRCTGFLMDVNLVDCVVRK